METPAMGPTLADRLRATLRMIGVPVIYGAEDAPTPTDVIEVEDTEASRALFAGLDEPAVEVDPETGQPVVKEAPAVAPVVAPAVAPVVAPAVETAAVKPALSPADALRRRAVLRRVGRASDNLDAVEAARLGRRTSTPVVIPAAPKRLTDADWARVEATAKAEAAKGASYEDAAAAAIRAIRTVTTEVEARPEDPSVAANRHFATLQSQAEADYEDFWSVLTESGILNQVLPQNGVIANPSLNRDIYSTPNPPEEMYFTALTMLARKQGKPVEDLLRERNLLPEDAAAPAVPVTPAAKAPAAAAPAAVPTPDALAEARRAGAREAATEATKNTDRFQGLKRFIPAGTPTRQITAALLDRAMNERPDAYMKWAEQNPDLDRAFMSGELDHVGAG